MYAAPEQHWGVYETCEELVDLEDNFQLWRFRHLQVVQRTIGHKTGTGGSSGVDFLRRALDLTFFPELYAVRTRHRGASGCRRCRRGPGRMGAMLLRDLVETSGVVAATRSRKAKVAAIAERLAQAEVAELPVVTAYLGGTVLQRRTGVGWRGVSALPEPAAEPTLTALEVHETLDHLAGLSGPGSQEARASGVRALFARATADEQRWLRGVLTGNVRQGALDALVQEAIAAASGVKLTVVRRAAMLAGGTVPIVVAAMTGGEEALAEVGLEVGRPVLPMLASSAPDVPAAMEKAGGGQPVAVDVKLDGIRIQVHRRGDEVQVATRSLDDITERLPEVVAVARSLPAQEFVLDGEALALGDDGRPRPFQETASRTAQADHQGGVAVTPYFFDVLHVDGHDLLDAPGSERLAALDALVPEEHRVPRLVTDVRRRRRAVRAGGARAGPRGRGGEEPLDRVRRGPSRQRAGSR